MSELRNKTVRLAFELANYPGNVSAEWDDDNYIVSVNNPTSPVELIVRHYAGGQRRETGRVHAKVPRDGVSNGTVVRTARRFGLEVMDIWQLSNDLLEEMGPEGREAIKIGLEMPEQ